jgi:hypothetical protein
MPILSAVQLTTLSGIAHTRIAVGAANYDAACWNWALNGVQANAPDPRDMFGYVSSWPGSGFNAQQLEVARDACRDRCYAWAYFATGPEEQRRERKSALRQIQVDYGRNGNALEARRRVFQMALRVAGLTVSDAVTAYRIVSRCDNVNDVMDDHWWIEVANTHTFETIPNVPILLEHEASVHNIEVVNPGQPLPTVYQVAYLTELKANHITQMAQLLAAPNFPSPPGTTTVLALGYFQNATRNKTSEQVALIKAAWGRNDYAAP